MTIEINSKEKLVSLLTKGTSSHVLWEVKPFMSPDQIGSSRMICFYIDDIPLSENGFHDELRTALTELADIPVSGKEKLITGEGDITELNGDIHVEYSTISTVPYSDEFLDKTGSGILDL